MFNQTLSVNYILSKLLFLVSPRSYSLITNTIALTLLQPHGLSRPGSSVHGILQARILEWVAIPLSRGIFLTQGLNPGLLHCRQILYRLSHQRLNPLEVYLKSEHSLFFCYIGKKNTKMPIKSLFGKLVLSWIIL